MISGMLLQVDSTDLYGPADRPDMSMNPFPSPSASLALGRRGTLLLLIDKVVDYLVYPGVRTNSVMSSGVLRPGRLEEAVPSYGAT